MNIVQIGCHLGHDHVYDFVSKNLCNKIILIDANPYALDICKKQYINISNTTFLNYAIVPNYNESRSIKFFIPKNDTTSAHCSTSLSFIQKHDHKEWLEIDVECITLNDLFKSFKLYDIDKLYIDAEGLDAQIILSLNLLDVNIKYIYFEHMHSDGAFSHGLNLDAAILKLKNHRYQLKENDMYNLGYEKI
jgi:FkbM family methyltransferase